MDKSRLYYQTPYVKSFMCTVERCEASGKGTWLAVLNQTGFYPEGGGQPSDTGTLNQVPVLSVHEQGEEILHELASPLEPGTLAEGVIDWQKRYDNMQQHTGEHILSGLVHRRYGYDNVGFHMGAGEVTVDFNGIMTAEELDGLERYHIPDEVMQYIANNITSNIRELEGSLNKLIALANLENKPIDIPLAAEALKDMISPNNTREITPELIIEVVSDHFNVPAAELKGKKRNAEIVLPRQIVMYLCRKMTDTPLKTIGLILGGKDHASVSHGVKKIEHDVKTDEALNNTVNIIKKKLNPI